MWSFHSISTFYISHLSLRRLTSLHKLFIYTYDVCVQCALDHSQQTRARDSIFFLSSRPYFYFHSHLLRALDFPSESQSLSEWWLLTGNLFAITSFHYVRFILLLLGCRLHTGQTCEMVRVPFFVFWMICCGTAIKLAELRILLLLWEKRAALNT